MPEQGEEAIAAVEIDSDESDDEFSDDDFLELMMPEHDIPSPTATAEAFAEVEVQVVENRNVELGTGDAGGQVHFCECGMLPCIMERHQLHANGLAKPSMCPSSDWGIILPETEVSV